MYFIVKVDSKQQQCSHTTPALSFVFLARTQGILDAVVEIVL